MVWVVYPPTSTAAAVYPWGKNPTFGNIGIDTLFQNDPGTNAATYTVPAGKFAMVTAYGAYIKVAISAAGDWGAVFLRHEPNGGTSYVFASASTYATTGTYVESTSITSGNGPYLSPGDKVHIFTRTSLATAQFWGQACISYIEFDQ